MNNEKYPNRFMWQYDSMYIEAKHGRFSYCKRGLNDTNHLFTKGDIGVFDSKRLLDVLPSSFVTTCDKFFNLHSSLLNHTMNEKSRQVIIFADVTVPIGEQMYIRFLCQIAIKQARTSLWNSDFKARILQFKVYKEENDVHFVQLYNTKDRLFLKNWNPKLDRNHLLSKKELLIFRLYVDDMSRSKIAHVLGKSEATIGTHLRNVYKRLDINSQMQAKTYIESLNYQPYQLD